MEVVECFATCVDVCGSPRSLNSVPAKVFPLGTVRNISSKSAIDVCSRFIPITEKNAQYSTQGCLNVIVFLGCAQFTPATTIPIINRFCTVHRDVWDEASFGIDLQSLTNARVATARPRNADRLLIDDKEPSDCYVVVEKTSCCITL